MIEVPDLPLGGSGIFFVPGVPWCLAFLAEQCTRLEFLTREKLKWYEFFSENAVLPTKQMYACTADP